MANRQALRQIRLRHICAINPPVPELRSLPVEEAVTFLPMEAVGGRLDLSNTRPRGHAESGYSEFREGDLLLPKITPTFEHGRSVVAERLVRGVGFGSTELHVLRPDPEAIDVRYLLYVTKSSEFLQSGAGEMYGVAGQKRVSDDFVKDYRVVLPSLNEQRAIVRFLDEETATVDALVEKKQRLLELADEQRRAFLIRSVTKGFSDDVTMRPSGIEWIGDVPTHWSIRRIKQVARLASGHTPSRSHPEYWLDLEIPWFQLTDIWRFRDDSEEVVRETFEMISQVGLRNSAAELLPPGTVALSRTASVGFSAILGKEMATTQDFANWIPGPLVDSAYLLFVLRAMRPELERLRFGSTHKTIYMPDISQLVMPLPPLEEQRRIVSHVRSESSRLFQVRDSLRTTVEKLKEYRAALITAAVTGQIDVPGAA